MVEHKIKKLPLVERRRHAARPDHREGSAQAAAACRSRRATRSGRLRVGAAIGATGDYLERAAELLSAGVDVLVIDIAHGHSLVMAAAIDAFRKRFGDVELIAGNVATAEGARFLLERGVNAHQGRHRPRRRLHDAADDELRRAAGAGAGRSAGSAVGDRVPLIADGGIKRARRASRRRCSSAATRVMLGSAFAGTEETPGDIVQKSVLMPESQKIGAGAVQGVPRHGVARRRSAIASTSKTPTRVDVEALGAEGHGGQRAGARLGAAGHPRHAEAPVLVDQLRRRDQPARVAAEVLGGARALPRHTHRALPDSNRTSADKCSHEGTKTRRRTKLRST